MPARLRKHLQWPQALDAATLALATRLGSEPPAPVVTPPQAVTGKSAEPLLQNLAPLSDEQVASLEAAPQQVA